MTAHVIIPHAIPHPLPHAILRVFQPNVCKRWQMFSNGFQCLEEMKVFFFFPKKKWRSYAIWQNSLESSSRLSRQTTLAAHYSPEWLMIRAYVGFFSHHLSYGPVCMHKSYRMAWTFQANVLGFVFDSVCLVVVHSTVNASLICLLDGSNQRTLCIK